MELPVKRPTTSHMPHPNEPPPADGPAKKPGKDKPDGPGDDSEPAEGS